MQNNLLSIFKAITPDNIKDIPVIEDSMRIFIELLNENSAISSDIKVALSEQTTDSIAEELPKIYLWDYYSMINNLKTDKTINDKFRNWNEILKPSLYPKGYPYIGGKLLVNYFTIGEPGGVLTSDSGGDISANLFPFSEKLSKLESNILQNKAENYYSNRKFKESKGLIKSINFIYDIINEYLVNESERLSLNIQETGNPFELTITGSIDKDVYRESVAYLSHPLGFVYDYQYISELKFEDDFSLSKIYKINTLEVRCLSGNVEPYSQEVQDIISKENYVKILFKDSSYLLQENDIVRYYSPTDTLIKMYPAGNHCSIYADYDVIYSSTITDNLEFLEKTSPIDTYSGLTETTGYTEEKTFRMNFIIESSVIGSELITNDTDLFESSNIKEEFDIVLI